MSDGLIWRDFGRAYNEEINMESIQTIKVKSQVLRVRTCVHCDTVFMITQEESDNPAAYDIRCPSCLWRGLPGYAVEPENGEIYSDQKWRRLPHYLLEYGIGPGYSNELHQCSCGNVFEDEEMIQICIEDDHDLELEEYECSCGQVYQDPEAVVICEGEGHPF